MQRRLRLNGWPMRRLENLRYGRLESLRYVCRWMLAIAMLVSVSAEAKPSFMEVLVQGHSSETLVCDLDGDGLKDLVLLLPERKLAVHYQDARTGFSREPQQEYSFGDTPALYWTARVGQTAESLLVMTSDGVSEVDFRERKAAPVSRRIIEQTTMVPNAVSNMMPMHFPLSASTGGVWPLVLVPVGEDLQVWRHEQQWERVQTIKQALGHDIRRAGLEIGYQERLTLNGQVGDLNGDRRDDLVLRTDREGKQFYAIHLQNSNGLFNLTPSLTREEKLDWFSWLCWIDLNKDGQVDLVKNTWLAEPWFVPGFRSGKVLARLYYADARGQFTSEPQQVFRKNDWIPSIPVVDVDGDGYTDMVLGYSAFDSREGLRKALVAKQLDFNLQFHFSRSGARFAETPDCQMDLQIRLERHSLLLSYSQRYYFEHFVELQGDFNGDGRKDVLVKDGDTRLSAYFFVSREKGFNKKADLRFECGESIHAFAVEELNGDGVSDLWVPRSEGKGLRVFLSQSAPKR